MAKSKGAKPVDSKGSSDLKMNKVKDGRVARATEPIPSKVDPPKTKKSKRAPTPPSESESESESEAESDDDVASASDSSSESESDDEGTTKKAAAPKVNGNAKLTNGDVSSGSESDDEDASDDDAVPPKATKALGSKAPAAAAAASDDESSSGSEESESEEETVAGQTVKAAKSGAVGKEDSSDDDSSESDADEEDDDDEEEALPPSAADIEAKKRKAEVLETPVAKKTKTETAGEGATNLFVGNVSWNVDEEWLSREFAEYGEVVGCRIITDRDTGRSRGFGYVDFASADDAAKALEGMQGFQLDGRALNVDASTNRSDKSTPRDRANSRAKQFGDASSPPSDTLWIGNLPWGSDAESLKQRCEEFGSVASVRIPTDRETGEIKGFGYVSFGSIDDAKAAQQALAGSDFNGRPMRIDFAGPRPEREDGNVNGFRGGRGGGGFRGGRGGGDRGGGGFGGGFRGGRGDFRGGRGGGRGGSTNRGGVGDFSGRKVTF